jgi:hypothetical protein
MRVRLNAARARLERQVRRAVFGGTPTWKRRPNALPWFDRPDALARIDRKRGDAGLLEHWVRDGYAVVRDCVHSGDIDAMIATLDGLWDVREPIPDLELIGLRETIRDQEANLSHRDLLGLDASIT